MVNNEIVSFDDEMLIVVDREDNILGYRSKAECHEGEGILHRAFSIFIFNDQGQLLLQQRSAQKLLWPLFWSNSCCSHPRKGESLDIAVHRRLQQELGFETKLNHLFAFQYQAKFKHVGSENEMCAVFIGKSNASISVNENEIAAWKYINSLNLSEELARNPEKYTPWFKMEWERIVSDFWNDIESL